MSTAVQERPAEKSAENKPITYVPLGGKISVELTVSMVRSFLCTPTKSGTMPTNQDIMKFMMLCRARELDPWVGDAYLVGYDGNDGPQFSLITAHQALLKRAEMSAGYDGMQSGVIVKRGDNEINYREGDLTLEGETLVGGWARCFRKDQKQPSYDALKFSTFNTNRSRWAKDPAGMIVKCSEASVLRKSFPTQLGGLFTQEEMDHLSVRRIDARETGSVAPALSSASNLDSLAERLEGKIDLQLPKRLAAENASPPADSDAPDPADIIHEWTEHVGTLYHVADYDDAAMKLTADTRLTDDQKMPIVGIIAKGKKSALARPKDLLP